jgi:3-methyladenine DNA glycosylase AlkD
VKTEGFEGGGLDAALAAIDRHLRAVAVPERAQHERSYLKSELVHYGASVPAIRRVAMEFLATVPDLRRDDLVALVERLWRSRVHELRMAAIELLVERVALLTSADLALVERLLREARTWALVDPLAVQVAGPLLEAHPEPAAVVERWAADPDHWIRRSALLAHLQPMRRGDEAVFARFTAVADAMLEEREFFVCKALGWVLRERAKVRPDEVFAWLLPRRGRAAGLTLREACKPMTPERRAQLVPPKRSRSAVD